MKAHKYDFSRISGEFTIIFLIISCFWGSASLSSITKKSNLGIIIAVNIILLFGLILSIILWRKGKKREYLKKNIYEYKELIVILIFSAILRIIEFGTLPRWDTETYFMALMEGCENFSFTPWSYLENFRLCSHPSLGYCLFIAIGGFITPYNILGVNLVNLLLTLICLGMVYSIIRYLIPDSEKIFAALGTLLFSVQPMLLGTFANLSLDYGLLIFIIFILYFHIKKYNILFAFFSSVLVQTKETGIIILLGYTIGYILYIFWTADGTFVKRIKALKKDTIFIILSVVIFGGSLYYFNALVLNNMALWGGELTFGDNTQALVNYFDINRSYIILKIKTICILNFSWIFLGTLLFGLFKIFAVSKTPKKRLLVRNNKCRPLAAYLCCLFSLLVFSCVYITYNNPRYHLPLETGWVLVAALFIIQMAYKNKKRFGKIILIFLTALELLQSYTTIDPVSIGVFTAIDTGNAAKMIHVGWSEMPSLIADIAVYNNQYTYLDKAYDKILKEIGFDENQDIIIWGDYGVVRATFLEGMKHPIYWDTKKEKRTFERNANCIPVKVIYQKDFAEREHQNKLNKKAVLIDTPIYGENIEDALTYLSNYYEIEEKKEEDVMGQGRIYYYQLTLREE